MARLLIQSEGTPPLTSELNWGITRVGRGDDNDVVLNYPFVSYHHCELELGLNGLRVRDHSSTNGTFVNDQRIQEAHLESGQKLCFGRIWATVEYSSQPIVVPEIAVKRPPESMPLANGVMSCHSHPSVPSVWHCLKCAQYFCLSCVRGVNLVGRPVHKLCPLCSDHVVLAPWVADREKKPTLWGRVKKAFNRTSRLR